MIGFLNHAVYARVANVRGVVSCGTWVQDSQKKGWAEVTNQKWLLGLLSGVSVALDEEFLAGKDNVSLFLWMDNYCKANPLKNAGDGGLALAAELIKNKGK